MENAPYLRRIFPLITARSVFIFVLMFAGLFVATNAKAQTEETRSRATVDPPQNIARGHSMVRGRARYEDTGKPAPRERVELVAGELIANHPSRYRIPTALTDEDGEFSFHNDYKNGVRPAICDS